MLPKRFVRRWGKKGSNDLIDIMDQVSNDLRITFEARGEDAQKILKEARTRAEQEP